MGRRPKNELVWFHTTQGFAGPEVSARAGETFQALPSQVEVIRGVTRVDAPTIPDVLTDVVLPVGFDEDLAAMLAEAQDPADMGDRVAEDAPVVDDGESSVATPD